jgi:hypothetical protein
MSYSFSDPFSDQSLHLSHEQLCDHLLATTALDSSADPAASASSTGFYVGSFHVAGFHVVEDHLRACPLCAAELSSLQSSLTNFRAATTRFADQELARLKASRPQTQFVSLMPQRKAPLARRPFLWACAAVLLVGATTGILVPVALHHQDRAVTTAAVSPAQEAAPAPESDQALLEEVDDDLSSSVPSAMQPLSDPLPTQSTDTRDSGAASLSPNLKARKITHE